MELALLLNPADTQRNVTGHKPTVFVEFSGHVSLIKVRVYETGWGEETCPCGCGGRITPSPLKQFEVVIDKDNKSINNAVNSCLSYLEALYAEWKDKAPENV
jgi:hypothetical protein